MSRPKPSGRSYGRLTRHERNTVERMLDRNRSAREIAAELGRSPSTVTREVAAHRYVTAPRSRYGEPAPADLSGACPRLSAWPRWIGNIYLDDSGRDSPASLNSTGDM